MTSEGIPFEPVYVRSHDSVYKAVADGLYPAGGGVKRTFKSMDAEIQDKLHIAWTTDKYTPHALAVHPRVEEDKRVLVQKAFQSLDDPTEFAEILEPIRFKGWELAVDDDWNDVRELELNALMGSHK